MYKKRNQTSFNPKVFNRRVSDIPFKIYYYFLLVWHNWRRTLSKIGRPNFISFFNKFHLVESNFYTWYITMKYWGAQPMPTNISWILHEGYSQTLKLYITFLVKQNLCKIMVFCYQNCSDLLWEKNCSSDQEKLEQIIQLWNRMLF